MECEKCGELFNSWVTTTFFGGVSTEVCPKCRTEWDKFVKTHPKLERARYLIMVANSIASTRELAQDEKDPAMIGVLKEYQKIEGFFHYKALEWLGRE